MYKNLYEITKTVLIRYSNNYIHSVRLVKTALRIIENSEAKTHFIKQETEDFYIDAKKFVLESNNFCNDTYSSSSSKLKSNCTPEKFY